MSALSRSSSVAPPSRPRRWLKRFLAATMAAVVAGGGLFAVTEPAAAARSHGRTRSSMSVTGLDPLVLTP